MWDSNKRYSIHVTGIPETERGKSWKKIYEELMPENFPNLARVKKLRKPQKDKPKEIDAKTHHKQTFEN